jgi:NAD(P)-dependent dehydrogenase (short-subunit alcohol dehydrogenase family)
VLPQPQAGADEAVDAGGGLIALRADVADESQVAAAVEVAARRLGRIDAVVNSAGIDCTLPLERLTLSAWSRTLAVNLTGAMLVCRAALPHLRAAGQGSIVNVASAAGLVPLAGRSAYNASKAGLIMFGKTLAQELADDGIRVNAVCPGAIDTPLLHSGYAGAGDARTAQTALEAIRARYALGRIGSAAEVAEAILFLASPAASFITGVALAVDGGRSWH